jgi:hypothetical protein
MAKPKTQVEKDLEKLREVTEQVTRLMETIRESGISDNALALLIQHSAGNIGGRKIPIRTIWAVINGIESLEEFVFPQED